MNKRKAGFFPLIFLVFLFSCASTQEIKRSPAFRFVDITLSKAVEDQTSIAVPKNPTTIFSPKDPEVVAFLKLENLWGVHTLKWDWFDPGGNLYYSTGDYIVESAPGKYLKQVTTWHKLSIRGQQAGKLIGDWTLNIFLDKEVVAVRNFRIDMEVEELPEITHRPNPKYWGLVIGIENYHQLPPVNYAQKDALLIKQYFIRVLGVPEANIIYLVNSEATKARIMFNLRTYIPRNIEQDSLLYVYFVGHGVLNGGKEDPYIIPYDGNVRFSEDTSYRLKDFYEDLENLQIRRSSVFLDTSFNGIAARSDNLILPGAKRAVKPTANLSLSSGKVISMISATEGQVSNAYPEKGHGLFTYFLLRGLRGEAHKSRSGSMTMGELYSYVKDHVGQVSLQRGMEQTPILTPSLDKVKGIEIE